MQECPREIPPACHYQSAAQAELWGEVHRRHSPAGEAGYAEFYRGFFRQSVEQGECRCRCLVTLGAGTGWKEAGLGAVLAPAGLRRVRAIDADARLIEETEEAFRREGFTGSFEGVVGDLMTEPLGRGEEGIGITALGILPNVDAPRFLASLRGRLDPGTPVWLSANLTSPGQKAVLAQYDNPETRAWLEAFFTGHGVREEDLRWSWQIRDLPYGWRVEGWVEFRAPVELWLDGVRCRYGAGDGVRAFYSNRMDFQAWGARLEAAGFEVVCARDGFGDGLWACRRMPGVNR